MRQKQRIAIIGSGISGLGAAFALKDVADLTIFEADTRIGGHSNTIDVPYRDGAAPVDTGFIVYNERNYPNLKALFAHLGVETVRTDMSFAFSAPDGLEWSSQTSFLPFQLINMLRSDFRAVVSEWARFNTAARKALSENKLGDESLGQFLDALRVKDDFRRKYLYPMGAAIWSTSEHDVADQPAETFLRFFDNHGLLSVDRPKWRTVAGGSREYVSRLIDALGRDINIHLHRPVARVIRHDSHVTVEDASGRSENFDEVVLACHADQAAMILSDADETERAMLAAVRYAPNLAVAHSDRRAMPKRRTAWGAWNYRITGEDGAASVSYHMNRLQPLPRDLPVYVTLNPTLTLDADKVITEIEYAHPQFTATSFAAQRCFNKIQGVRRVWYAGAWLGYGFHEDGLRAGLRVGLKLGGAIPWTFAEGDVDGGAWGERMVANEAQRAARAT